MLKQEASSHNLALRETRRQREKVPLLKDPVFTDLQRGERKGGNNINEKRKNSTKTFEFS